MGDNFTKILCASGGEITMTPREKAELTIKALEKRKKNKERDLNNYESHRAGVIKAIKFRTGVYR